MRRLFFFKDGQPSPTKTMIQPGFLNFQVDYLVKGETRLDCRLGCRPWFRWSYVD